MPKKKKSAENSAASNHRNPYEYCLVKDKYYRHAWIPTIGGGRKMSLLPIARSQIEEFFPDRDQRDCIPYYIDFAMIPQNVDYQRVIDGFYNAYSPPVIKPEEGSWPTIDEFLRHLFGGQKDLALDYLELTYRNPAARLPVLVLLSRERGTGKTTFLKLLSAWFGDNMANVNAHSLRSRFNGNWAGKLIVAIDEALLDRRQDSELVKALATAETWPRELKGRDSIDVPNYSHIILCSNNLEDPIIIDPEENRYWVVEVPPLQKDDPFFVEKLKAELPAFAWYLLNRHHMVYPEPQGRLWFPPGAYETDALRRIKQTNIPQDQQVVAEVLLDILIERDLPEICMTMTEVQMAMIARGFPWVRPRKAVKLWREELGFGAQNCTYDSYLSGGMMLAAPVKKTGRFFRFTREFLERHV